MLVIESNCEVWFNAHIKRCNRRLLHTFAFFTCSWSLLSNLQGFLTELNFNWMMFW